MSCRLMSHGNMVLFPHTCITVGVEEVCGWAAAVCSQAARSDVQIKPGRRVLYAHRGLHLSPCLLPMSVQRIGSFYHYRTHNCLPPRQLRRGIPQVNGPVFSLTWRWAPR